MEHLADIDADNTVNKRVCIAFVSLCPCPICCLVHKNAYGSIYCCQL